MASLTAIEHTAEQRSLSRKLSAGSHSREGIATLTALDGKQSIRNNSSSKSINLVGGSNASPAPSVRSRPEAHHPQRGRSDEEIPMDVLGSQSESKAADSTQQSVDSPPQPHAFNMSIKDERIYLATLSYCLFVAGWNDGTLGPLLPRIQEYYGINYTVVSMLFVSGCAGVLVGATSNVHLSDKLGFGKLITLAAAAQMGAYAIMAPAPPFPVMCVVYALNGFALSLQDAQSNAFIASIPRNGDTNMGILHAVYGLGAFAAPLVATQFAQAKRWSFHFLASVGVSLLNTALLLLVFRLKRQQEFIPEAPHDGHAQSSDNKYKQILRNRSVQLMALWICAYVGVEVTLGGWTYTFLLRHRGGTPSAGYVSSGFFGGLTLGRVVLLPLNAKLGNERAIYLYSVLCIALEFTVWFVPNLISNAVAVSIVGLLLGPFYPIAMNVTAAILPPWILAGSIGYIAAMGQAGAAALPFMTGALASKYGVQVLQPLIVAMMVASIIIWWFVTHSKTSRAD